MSVNTLRSARWLQTFAQILEVDVQRRKTDKFPKGQSHRNRRLPLESAARRTDHD